jgi:hypothetical protein
MANQLLVISPNEIKLQLDEQIYKLRSFPSLGFAYSYLYYEPISGNLQKVLEDHNHQLILVPLTDNDILLIQEQLAKFSDAAYLQTFLEQHEYRPELFAAPGSNENAPPGIPVHCVDSNNGYMGMQILPQPGLKQVSKSPPKDLYLESFGVSWIWDDAAADWVVQGNYKDQRRLRYLEDVPLTEQIGALMQAVQALSQGQPLPADFISLVNKIQDIKNNIPKA